MKHRDQGHVNKGRAFSLALRVLSVIPINRVTVREYEEEPRKMRDLV